MMKKIILLLTFIIFTPVWAQEYSEYVYVGTQESRPIVDELTKYEQVRFHKYYSRTRGPSIILDAYDPEKEKKDYCDETPISEQTVYSLLPSENYSNENWIILRGHDNYEVTTLKIENLNTTRLTIEKITIKQNDLPISTIELSQNEKDFSIPIKNIDLDDLVVELTYKSNGINRIVYTLEGNSSSQINIIATLKNDNESTYIRGFSLEKHAEYIEKHGLSNNKYMELYVYRTQSYSCYDFQLEYHGLFEDDYLEGYTYDSLEDVILYKVYKRTKIEEPSSQNEIPNTPLKKPEKPIEVDQKLNHYDSQEGLYPNRNESTIVEIEDDRLAYLDHEKEEKMKENVEEQKPYDDLKVIKFAILLLIIFAILHTILLINVNKDK